MKLFLDDDRPTPSPEWVRAYSVNEAIKFIMIAESIGVPFEYASLDNDLGEYFLDGGDGHKLVEWMAECDIWPLEGIEIHSGNSVERPKMLATIDRYSPFPLSYHPKKRGFIV